MKKYHTLTRVHCRVPTCRLACLCMRKRPQWLLRPTSLPAQAITVTGSRIRSLDALSSATWCPSAPKRSRRPAESALPICCARCLRYRTSVLTTRAPAAPSVRCPTSLRVRPSTCAAWASKPRLSLVDGKRPIRGGEARYFDMDNIPSIVLRRVEVVPDGASAIYGSDAVTGVVNLLPYHSVDGITVRLERRPCRRPEPVGLQPDGWQGLGRWQSWC